MRSVVVFVSLLVMLTGCLDRSAPTVATDDAGVSIEPVPTPGDAGEEAEPEPEPAKDAGHALQPNAATAHDAGALAQDASVGDLPPPSDPQPMDAGNKPPMQPLLDAAIGGDDTPHTPDAATPIVDAGTPPTPDASTPPVDAGAQEPVDAGAAVVDAGTPPPLDAGAQPTVDAGTPPAIDAGTPTFDSGTTPVIDAGTPVTPDAGPPDAGSDAGTTAPDCAGPPGMYKDQKCQVLSDGIRLYHPKYPLWSDGAVKERFIYLPPGSQINTVNPDRWSFPVGTRLYKSFASGQLRVETRVFEKTKAATSIDSWTMTSYAWSADNLSVSPANTNGVTNALGTGLDIPSQAQCRQCHNQQNLDPVNGFSAIQLNHSDDGLTLNTLLNERTLINGTANATMNVTLDNARIPGDAVAQAALGYLLGNCGHCHGGPTPRVGMRLASVVGTTDLTDEPIFQTAVCHCLENWTKRKNATGAAYELRVSPSHAALSGIIGRMSSRTTGEQMPPIGTKLTDPTGLATIKAWIDSLDATECESAPPVCGN